MTDTPPRPRRPRGINLTPADDPRTGNHDLSSFREEPHPADRAFEPHRAGILDPEPVGWPNGEPHPAHGPKHLLPRDAEGRIPTYYYCSPLEIAQAGLTPPNLRREARIRHDGMTPETQRLFIETLAATASVSAAAARAGVSRTTAYRLRNLPDAHAFRAAWDQALRVAVGVLADTAFERAVEGTAVPVIHKGEVTGYQKRYNDRLLMFLLRVRDPANYAPLAELPHWQAIRPAEDPAAALTTALAALDAAEPAAALPPPAPALQAPGPVSANAHTCPLRPLKRSRRRRPDFGSTRAAPISAAQPEEDTP